MQLQAIRDNAALTGACRWSSSNWYHTEESCDIFVSPHPGVLELELLEKKFEHSLFSTGFSQRHFVPPSQLWLLHSSSS